LFDQKVQSGRTAELLLNYWPSVIQLGRENRVNLRKQLSVNNTHGERTLAGSFIQAPVFAVPPNRNWFIINRT